MPRQPQWLHRLDAIIQDLEERAEPVVGRAEIASLFGISGRQALRLCRNWGAHAVGGACVFERRELMERLRRLTGSESIQAERQRREEFGERLGQLERAAAGRRVRLGGAEGPGADVGRRIEWRPGRMICEFGSAEELMEQLLWISRRAAADWEGFRQAVEREIPFDVDTA
ncbi:MAG: hypothetical protein K2Q23_08330 [Bryobacteraceae bacterium]|nr:hypothetical protein [Bryobacteraceae bacterium]